MGGGPFRTTPWASKAGQDARAEYDKMMGYVKALPAQPTSDAEKDYVPPVSMMAVVGLTHTQADLFLPARRRPLQARTTTSCCRHSADSGVARSPTISAPSRRLPTAANPRSQARPGRSVRPHTWTWDNTDVRYANTAHFGPLDFVYGITANNNPTVQDLWNTTPAWGFPYAYRSLASTPGASTAIEGAFAAHVAGVGGYTMINDLLYLEFTGLQDPPFSAQNNLGMNPFGAAGQFGAFAPYCRIALEPHWGRNTFMVGAFGVTINVHPWVDTEPYDLLHACIPQSDVFTDSGSTTQYQYQGDNWWLTLRGSYIREFQQLNSSFVNAGTNPTDLLNSLKLQASFAYGADNSVVFTATIFRHQWGTADIGPYGTDPATDLP